MSWSGMPNGHPIGSRQRMVAVLCAKPDCGQAPLIVPEYDRHKAKNCGGCREKLECIPFNSTGTASTPKTRPDVSASTYVCPNRVDEGKPQGCARVSQTTRTAPVCRTHGVTMLLAFKP